MSRVRMTLTLARRNRIPIRRVERPMNTSTRPVRSVAALLVLASILNGCDVLRMDFDPVRPKGQAPHVTPGPSVPAGSAQAIEGTTWTLSTIRGAAVPAQPPMTLEFRGGRAVGSGGCNSFGGVYSTSGSELRFDDIASTQIGCFENAIGDREGAYLAALSATRTWAIVDGRLRLSDEQGALLLVLVAGPVLDQ